MTESLLGLSEGKPASLKRGGQASTLSMAAVQQADSSELDSFAYISQNP